MKYKYEFEMDNFEKGDCSRCPFSYVNYDDPAWDYNCVLFARYDECPLEEVSE